MSRQAKYLEFHEQPLASNISLSMRVTNPEGRETLKTMKTVPPYSPLNLAPYLEGQHGKCDLYLMARMPNGAEIPLANVTNLDIDFRIPPPPVQEVEDGPDSPEDV